MSEGNVVIMGAEGAQEVSLEAILGVDLTEIQENRQTVTPAGKFHWQIKDASLEAVDAVNKDDPDGPKISKPVIKFELEAVNCFSLINADLNPEDFIGRKHYESTWITKVAQDIGRVKAFLVDIGLEANKPLDELLAEAHGHEFCSSVTNVKDKNNPDRVYANLKDVQSMEVFAEKHPDLVGGSEEEAQPEGLGKLAL